jgi:predicted metal-dependent peptidase
VYLNPSFCDQLSDKQLTFVLAHEIMHLLLFHFGRRMNRKPFRWNRAADRAINFGLVQIGLEMPPMGLLPTDPAHNEYTTEELYEVEEEQPGDDGQASLGKMPGATGGCGVLPPQGGDGDGDDDGAEGEAPEDGAAFPSTAESARTWRQLAHSAEQNARSAGDCSGDLLARVLRVPPSKVAWTAVLRNACARAIAERGNDDVSWQRRNRRSFAGDFILPGGITSKALVAVAVDTSGSVSDEDLEQALSEVEAISRATGVAIFLVTHDAEVHFADWIRPGTRRAALAKTLIGRGGTLYTPAYAAIESASKKFDYAIHLTDGMPCETWPERPRNCRKLTVALIGYASRKEIPEFADVIEIEI